MSCGSFTEGSSTNFLYKKETTYNTAESGTGGKALRRVTGTLNLAKPEVSSAEKRGDFSEVNVTHGNRSVNWSINGELYEGDYHEFIEAGLRRNFSGVTVATASATDTFSNDTTTLTRTAAGGESFVTDGFVVNQIVRLSDMSTTANNGRDMLVSAVTATTMNIAANDGGAALAADAGPNASALVFVAGVASSATDTFSIATGVLTRTAGGGESFLVDGFRKGQVVRLTGMATAGNNDRNLLITAVDATTVTLVAIDGGAAVADDAAANAAATLIKPGRETFLPESNHSCCTFTIERHDTKSDTSQVAYGNKVGTIEISAQPNQPPTINISGIGIDRQSYSGADAPQLTSAAAAGTGNLLSTALGYVTLNGANVAALTSFSLTIDVGLNSADVVGNNVSPDVFYGRALQATGSISVLRDSLAVEEIFDNETEVELNFILEAPGTDPKGFFNITLPRVKLNSADVDDPDGPVVVTSNFRALKYTTNGDGTFVTPIAVQDSSITV